MGERLFAGEGRQPMAVRVTSFDVARRAGVSRAAVSMALSGAPGNGISEATRLRVIEAAAELGYRPNSAARMLVRGDTETLGLVISDPRILPHDGYIPQLLDGVGLVCRRQGYRVLLEGLDADSPESSYQSLVESRRIDGLIVLNPRTDDADLGALIDSGFPLVLAGSVRKTNERGVNIAAGAGLKAAVDHLCDLGHRRIGLIPFSPRGLSATDGRVASLRRALGARGLALEDSAIEHAQFSAASGAEATQRLLARRPDLTAIFAGNDTIALGAIGAAARMRRPVPESLSLIGFDDLPFAAYLNPPLTTIRVDARLQGEMAAELLVRILRGGEIAEPRPRIGTQLILRGSCARAPS